MRARTGRGLRSLCACAALIAACSGSGGGPAPALVDGGAGTDAREQDAGGALDGGARDALVIEPSDAGPVSEWIFTAASLGTGEPVGDGVLGPILPFGVYADETQIVIVGDARADFEWAGTRVAAGGFVLALDPSSGALRWHRTVGSAVNAIAAHGGELVIAGSFHGEAAFEPAAGDPIQLVSRGATDAFVAAMSADGVFRWVKRFGSNVYDGAFGIAASADGIAVVGFVSGTTDFGGACASLSTYPGVDDGDGHPVGVWDAVLARFDADGACVDARIFGAPASDDAAFSVAVDDDRIVLSGWATGPLKMRTAAGETDLGGAPSSRPGPWMSTLAADGTPTATWLGSSVGRGRAVLRGASDVTWLFNGSGSLRRTDGAASSAPFEGQAAIATVRDDGHVDLVSLGEGTTDAVAIATPSLAGGGTAMVVASERSEPFEVVLTRIERGSISRSQLAAIPTYPFLVTAVGEDVWMVGFTSSRMTLGDPPVTIETGGQGNLVVVRLH